MPVILSPRSTYKLAVKSLPRAGGLEATHAKVKTGAPSGKAGALSGKKNPLKNSPSKLHWEMKILTFHDPVDGQELRDLHLEWYNTILPGHPGKLLLF